MTKCPKHPQYVAKRKPRAACDNCWEMWDLANEIVHDVGYDPAMVKSNFERNENDLYRTEPWVTDALLNSYDFPNRNIWEPACGCGDMANEIVKHVKVDVLSTDLVDRAALDFPYDFLNGDRHEVLIDKYDIGTIVTNPPFGKEAVAFARKIVDLVSGGHVQVGALLLRTEFSSASGRADLFAECNVFDCEIRLTKRPRWDDWWNGNPPQASPRHNYSWFVWNIAADQGTSPDGSRLLHREPTIRWAGP